MNSHRIAMTVSGAMAAVAIVAAAVAVRTTRADRPRVERPNAPPAPATASSESPPAVPEPGDTGALLRKIDALEAEVAALKKKLADVESRVREPEVIGGFRPAAPADLAQIRKWQALAMDPTKDAAERVDALLRLRITPSEPDGRTPEVVGAMLQLLESSADARIRADICRNVKRYVPLQLSAPLLRVLASDADEKVREEAAESLGPIASDPGVRAALEHAAKNDPSEKVRKQAGESLKP